MGLSQLTLSVECMKHIVPKLIVFLLFITSLPSSILLFIFLGEDTELNGYLDYAYCLAAHFLFVCVTLFILNKKEYKLFKFLNLILFIALIGLYYTGFKGSISVDSKYFIRELALVRGVLLLGFIATFVYNSVTAVKIILEKKRFSI